MSTAQNDQLFPDGENYRQTTLPNKQFNSERKHTVRKHALGEIKNVIHNQTSITPFKGLYSGSSRSLCTELLKKRTDHLKSQAGNHFKIEQAQKILPIAANKVEELQKKALTDRKTCNDKCRKSLEEIWSEMNVLESAILESLVNGDEYAEKDFEVPSIKWSSIELEAEFDFGSGLEDPIQIEESKRLEKILADDSECPEFPLNVDWINDL